VTVAWRRLEEGGFRWTKNPSSRMTFCRARSSSFWVVLRTGNVISVNPGTEQRRFHRACQASCRPAPQHRTFHWAANPSSIAYTFKRTGRSLIGAARLRSGNVPSVRFRVCVRTGKRNRRSLHFASLRPEPSVVDLRCASSTDKYCLKAPPLDLSSRPERSVVEGSAVTLPLLRDIVRKLRPQTCHPGASEVEGSAVSFFCSHADSSAPPSADL
jgi:hypothetical protein